MKPNNIINIINVYAPTSDSTIHYYAGRGFQQHKEELGLKAVLGNGQEAEETRMVATNLVEFCDKNGKIIANSCFQHPAKHITAWSAKKK